MTIRSPRFRRRSPCQWISATLLHIASDLTLRLYYSAHLTDTARAFAYENVPLPEARLRIAQLTERYGEKLMKEAAEELIEIRQAGKEEVATLKEYVRKIAAPLLGRPPVAFASPAAVSEPQQAEKRTERLDDDIEGEMDLRDDEPDEVPNDGLHEEKSLPSAEEPRVESSFETAAARQKSDAFRLASHDSTEAAGKPVRRSIKEVQTGFAAWVADFGQNAERLGPERLAEFSPRMRTVPDYILRFGDSPALVAIRPSLSKTQRHDLQEWQRVFGTHHAVLRIWPIKDKLRWIWTSETVFPAVDDTSAAASKPDTIPKPDAEDPKGPAPHKSTDYSHVSHRLDNLQDEMEGLDELLRQADEIQRQLRAEIEAIQDQLRRGIQTSTS